MERVEAIRAIWIAVLGLSSGCNTLIDLEPGVLRETSGAGGASSSGSGATCTDGSGGAGGDSTCGGRAWARWKPVESKSYVVTDETVVDWTTRLMWQRATPPESFTWQAANEYCEKLVLSGHCDWTLPKRIELASLVDYTRVKPAIDTSAFPDTAIESYWSSSPQASDSTSAWYVSFIGGKVDVAEITDLRRVRCVRGGGHP